MLQASEDIGADVPKRPRASLRKKLASRIAAHVCSTALPWKEEGLAAVETPPAPPMAKAAADCWPAAFKQLVAWLDGHLGGLLKACPFPMPTPATQIPNLWPYINLLHALNRVGGEGANLGRCSSRHAFAPTAQLNCSCVNLLLSQQAFVGWFLMGCLPTQHATPTSQGCATDWRATSGKQAGAASGKQAGATSGKQAGAASGKQAGATSGKQAGAASGKQAGAISGKQAGATSGKQAGAARGKQAGAASGKQAGAASGKQAGAASGKQAGAASGKQAGATSGKQAGATSGKQAGATSGKQAGATSGKQVGGRPAELMLGCRTLGADGLPCHEPAHAPAGRYTQSLQARAANSQPAAVAASHGDCQHEDLVLSRTQQPSSRPAARRPQRSAAGLGGPRPAPAAAAEQACRLQRAWQYHDML